MEQPVEQQEKQQQKSSQELTNKQRQYLRGLAHPLTPLVQIGREGISEGLIEMTRRELKTRELLKVKIGNNSGLEKQAAAAALSAKTESILVQLIGKTMILYKENKKRPKDQRIRLPRK